MIGGTNIINRKNPPPGWYAEAAETLIDSHCHLTYEPMYSSLKETVKRANTDGVKYLLTISTEDKSFHKILKIIKEFDCVYSS